MNFAVFEESSKFATEAIGAIRTVSALGMEESVVGRYERLLAEHFRKAREKVKWSTGVFALSDSIALLCMAFVLW
jgi:ABC-type multidrug transport system fused ATPase/permease subunit